MPCSVYLFVFHCFRLPFLLRIWERFLAMQYVVGAFLFFRLSSTSCLVKLFVKTKSPYIYHREKSVKCIKMHNKSAENLLAHSELDNGHLFSSWVTIELLSKLVTLTTSTLLTIVSSQNDLYREHQPCSPIKECTGTQSAAAESIKYRRCVHSRWTRSDVETICASIEFSTGITL